MLFPVRCLALVLSSCGLGEIWQCVSRHPQTCVQLAQLYTLLFTVLLLCVSFLNRCLPAVCSTMSTLCHPSVRFMVNCEQILRCCVSKAVLKKLVLYARSITWIDLVTRVKLRHLCVILGFQSCWILKCGSPCPLPSPVRPVVDTAEQYFLHFTDRCELSFSFWLIFYGFNIPPLVWHRCYYIRIPRISMIYFLQWK
jgi:hypothetical protein